MKIRKLLSIGTAGVVSFRNTNEKQIHLQQRDETVAKMQAYNERCKAERKAKRAAKNLQRKDQVD